MQVLSELISGVRGAELGSASIYARATSTLATVYADYDGTVALSQPLTLDSWGGVEVYVNEEVDVRVADADGVVIRLFSPMQTANSVEYIGPSFRGHRYSDALAGVNQPTSVQEILDKWITSAGMPDFNVDVGGVETSIENAVASFAGIFINVKAPQYGAAGDGTTDDSTAVQAALTYAGTVKGIVFFPSGSYLITATLTVPEGVSLWGTGPTASGLILGHLTVDLLEYGAGSTTGGFQEIRGLSFVTTVASTGKYISITAAGKRNVRMVNCVVSDALSHQGTQIAVNGSSDVVFEVESCMFALVDPPINNPIISADNANSRVILSKSLFLAAGAMGASGILVAARKCKAVACTFDMSGVTSGTYIGLLMSSTAQWTVTGCEFIPGAGTSNAMATASSSADTFIYTAGNIIQSGFTTPFSGFIIGALNPQIQIVERESAIRNVTSNASPLALDGHLYGTVIVTRSAAGAQQLTSTVGPPGALLTVVVYNAIGGGTALGANPDFTTGFYVGTPDLTAPADTKISVAQFRAVYAAGTGAWAPVATAITNI